jgi:hypothetical protein
MSIYRRFNFVFLAVALFSVLSLGLFNVAIDPYGVINSPTFPGVNRLKPEQDKNNSLFKPIEVIRIKPTTVLIGSSTAVLGLDPKHPALLHNPTAYNLGIAGANMYQVKAYLQHALTNQPRLKQVVISLDFYMFNDFSGDSSKIIENRLGKTSIPLEDLLSVTFSLKAFEASKLTLVSNLTEPDITPYYLNGMRNKKIEPDFQKISMKEKFKIMIDNYLSNPSYYSNYHFSNEFLNDFKTTVNLGKQHNIDLKVFLSPVHAAQLEAIRVAGIWSIFEQWKREISKVTPVWDFSDYNSITTEPISNDMKNFFESVHYRKEVGDLILNRMFHYHEETVPDDFGILLTAGNSESHLKKIRADREVWAKKNPDVVKLVQDLKRKIEEKAQNDLKPVIIEDR